MKMLLYFLAALALADPALAQVTPQMSLDQTAVSGCRRLAIRDPYNPNASKVVTLGCAVDGGIDLTAKKATFSGETVTVNRYLTVGEPSFNPSGAAIPNTGGLIFGRRSSDYPNGMLILKQEGFASDYEEASLAMYPMMSNRWSGLSIAPSGDPWNLPTTNVSSVAMQLVNGSSEERVVLSTHWFGNQASGFGEYRLAAYKNGGGRYWPVVIANHNSRQIIVDVDGSVQFTHETLGGLYAGSGATPGASAGDTIIKFRNPATANSARLLVTQAGDVDLQSLTGSNVAWFLRLNASLGGPRIVGAQPTQWLYETDVPADNRLWFNDAAGGQLRCFATNDGVNSFGQWCGVARSGSAITEVAIGGGIGSAPLRVMPGRTIAPVQCYSDNVCDLAGAGSPQGVASYAVGSTYRRTDGGGGSTFWVKESGTGNTGWVAK